MLSNWYLDEDERLIARKKPSTFEAANLVSSACHAVPHGDRAWR